MSSNLLSAMMGAVARSSVDPDNISIIVTIGQWPNNPIFGFAASPIPVQFGNVEPITVRRLTLNAVFWGTGIGRSNIRLSASPESELGDFPAGMTAGTGGTSATGTRQDNTFATRAGGAKQVDYVFTSPLITSSDTGLIIVTTLNARQPLELNF